MPEFEALGSFVVRDRGTVFTVKNPGGYPDPGVLVGRDVLIDGSPFRVKGVESYAIVLPYPDRFDFGLLVETPA